ncbi:hypothetical protein P1996_21740 [Xanthomonas perforans]|uniref:hypothetical protein n=2 Tax=Xanthomonas perforans TaxID=442694 RepID=UPI000998C067|nr:hypothetical protein [Xanthomonas perforans]OMQ20213.1 hypothetical protein XpCFBP7293_21375 [Xanthomonas perforans]OOW50460.1 hypothetical protein Xcnt_15250 [Xanthomonas campestris pv. centellae]TVS47115.1 hypothetical protein E2P66_21700 [Xanthomonas perforans]
MKRPAMSNNIADLFLSDLTDAAKAELAEEYADAAESDEERDAWRALATQYSLAARDQALGHNAGAAP